MANCVINDQILNSLVRLVIDHFQAMRQVDPEGLYVIAGLSVVFKRGFWKVLDQVWPYVLHSLSKVHLMPCRLINPPLLKQL